VSPEKIIIIAGGRSRW